MKLFKFLFALTFIISVSSCDDGKSLQKYYVENQEDSDFLAVDVPTSMFMNSDSMDEEQKATLQSIKKINLLALMVEQNPEKFETEKVKLNEIFKDEKYQLLMKYGGGDRKVEMYFTGEEDAIDELIVYGYDGEKGLGLARVLGEDMNPERIMTLMSSLEQDNINVSGIQGLGKMFGSSNESESDSLKVSIEAEVTED